jgi:carbonic anhydrase
VNFEGDAGSVSINGTVYYLRQLHWHSPTEHSVNGRRYDMELHMVHQSAQGKAAVIGVFYEIGAHDAFLHKFEPYLEMIADQHEREEKVGVIDPRGARGRASVYYRYMGSLTTPPCAEGVIWTIVRRVGSVSVSSRRNNLMNKCKWNTSFPGLGSWHAMSTQILFFTKNLHAFVFSFT